MNTEVLVNRFFEMNEYCAGETFNEKIFASMHDSYTKDYNKLDFAEQGRVAELINKRYKEERH